MADRGIVIRHYLTEKVDHVVVGAAGDADISKKDNDIVINGAMGIDAAKEAHGIVHRGTLGHVDVAGKLDGVTVGMSGEYGKRQNCARQAAGKDAAGHDATSPGSTRRCGEKFQPDRMGWFWDALQSPPRLEIGKASA